MLIHFIVLTLSPFELILPQFNPPEIYPDFYREGAFNTKTQQVLL